MISALRIGNLSIPSMFAAVALLGFSLTACNTIEGAGRDVAATGDAIGDAAQETKEELAD